MNLRLRTWCLAGLLLTGLLVGPNLSAQDDDAKEATPPAEKKAYDINPVQKPPTALERKAEEDRQRAIRADNELRSRLSNTVWNDLDLRGGAAGQLWMLRPAKQVGKRIEREWLMNDQAGLPRVGSWDVKNGEVVLTAMNGTVMGRGKLNEDETIVGKFIDADKHREYGQFRLREETKRNYRVLTMRGREPLRRK